MADKESKPLLGGLLGHPMVAALLVATGALVLRQVPLEGTRPAANEPRIEQRFAQQDVDARLWQDPFGAVARAREELPKKLGDKAGPEEKRHSDTLLAQEIVRLGQQSGVQEVVVLGVMLAGGPYAEYVESRRRTRYAVLAGLNAGSYSPIDTEHIGYFFPGNNDKLPHEQPVTVPYEWFEPAISVKRKPGAGATRSAAAASAPVVVPDDARRVLVMWLDADAYYQTPFKRIAQLFAPFVNEAAKAGSAGSASDAARDTGTDPAPKLTLRLLGPIGSDGLRAMVDEVKDWNFKDNLFAGQDVRFYSHGATVADSTLLDSLSNGRVRDDLIALLKAEGDASTVSQLLGKRGVPLVRTIGSDTALALAMTDELVRRGLVDHTRPVPGRPQPQQTPQQKLDSDAYRRLCAQGHTALVPPAGQPLEDAVDPALLPPSQIALVAEWDTLYGRSLRREFMIDSNDHLGFCVNRYNYVRGLDGLLPERGSAPSTDSAAKPGAKDEGRRSDGSFIERAEGQSQFDYLRRLAGRLRERDADLRRRYGPQGGLRAIGVLGNDVHDKLLVLQALQPEFPDAVFFTTDLDTRLLHPREQDWARNLLVASSFGLKLDDKLQQGTPPFRDGYQTSVYFTTRLALSEIRHGKPVEQAVIDRWLSPRLFEVGRTQAFDYSPASARSAATAASTEVATAVPAAAGASAAAAASAASAAEDVWACRSGRLAACTSIHPAPPRLYPALPRPALALGLGVLVLLLWLPALALSRMGRRRLRRFVARGGPPAGRWRRRAGLLGGVLLLNGLLPWCLAGQWKAFADWLTDYGNGKPLSMGEGISIWPSEAIHLFSFVLCLYLVLRGWNALTHNLDQISLHLRMGRTRRQLEAEQREQDASLPLWQRLINHYSLRPIYVGKLSTPAAADPAMSDTSRATWRFYIAQNRTRARFARSLFVTVVAVVLAYGLRQAFGEPSGAPLRGDLTVQVHHGLAMAAVTVMCFLVFYVADATMFCVRYLRELRHHASTWPQRTIRHFESRIGHLPASLMDHWIDLQFIAHRTACVCGLIYYPFIVLSLLLLSRSPYFDDWRMPTAVSLMAGLCVLLVLGCVVALRLSAEKSRRKALDDVRDMLMRANERGAEGVPATGQLDLLRRQIEELHIGAFAPFAQQPMLKAVLLPFATLGGTNLVDFLAMAKI